MSDADEVKPTFDVVEAQLKEATDDVKAKLVNLQHIAMLRQFVSEAEIKIKHIHVVARVLDFLDGLEKELIDACVAAGVLAPHVEEKK